MSKRWECSEHHVRNLISNGFLPAFRLGGKLLRIRVADVVEFENRQKSEPPEDVVPPAVAEKSLGPKASASLGQNAARASECLHFGTRRFGVAFVCYGVSTGIERRNVSRIATERRPFIQDLKRFPQTSDVVRISEPDQDRYGLGK
jgi:hypothetical protein